MKCEWLIICHLEFWITLMVYGVILIMSEILLRLNKNQEANKIGNTKTRI